MTSGNAYERWGRISQSAHWLIALLIFVIGIIGLTMGELPRTPRYFWVYTLHKSLGITVLVLMLLRLGWRLVAGAPKPLPGIPRWQRVVSSLTHWALYGLALAIPLSGWLYDSASGLRPFKFFGLFDTPKLVAPSDAISAAAHSTHQTLFWILLALVLVHAGAAFYHHLFQRDATLARMLPRAWVKSPTE